MHTLNFLLVQYVASLYSCVSANKLVNVYFVPIRHSIDLQCVADLCAGVAQNQQLRFGTLLKRYRINT